MEPGRIYEFSLQGSAYIRVTETEIQGVELQFGNNGNVTIMKDCTVRTDNKTIAEALRDAATAIDLLETRAAARKRVYDNLDYLSPFSLRKAEWRTTEEIAKMAKVNQQTTLKTLKYFYSRGLIQQRETENQGPIWLRNPLFPGH